MRTAQIIQRRDFIRLTALSGAALFVIGFLDVKGKTPQIANLSGDESPGAKMNAYIFIDSSGMITIYNNRPEMGQGTFESIPMIIAEELEVDIQKVNIMQSPASRKLYGDQMVVGSRSISGNFDLMRKIGASAKEILIMAAANRWNVRAEDCYAHECDGNPSGIGKNNQLRSARRRCIQNSTSPESEIKRAERFYHHRHITSKKGYSFKNEWRSRIWTGLHRKRHVICFRRTVTGFPGQADQF